VKKLSLSAFATVVLIAAAVHPRSIPAHPAEPALAADTISVVSLNMAKEQDCDRVLRDLQRAPRLHRADVLLLQEVFDADGTPSVAEKLARHLGYYAAFSPEATGVHDRGLAVVSRYPISGMTVQRLKAFNLRYHSRNRFAMAADVNTPAGPIHLWNVHLDTRLNAQQRLEQLRPVIESATAMTGPRLIAGDFNTNEFYWLGNVVPVPFGKGHGSTIRAEMQERGFRTPFLSGVITFPEFRRHLDWIFASGLQTVDSSVEPVAFSDHHALWTAMRRTVQ
jgi:endonuclease/exonuclease/phosphatase family metal-dependent hydrolase